MCGTLDSSLCGCCSLRQGTGGTVVYTAFVFVIALVAGRYNLYAATVTFSNPDSTGRNITKPQKQTNYPTVDFVKAQHWSEVLGASYFVLAALAFFALLGVMTGYLKKNPNYLLIWLIFYCLNIFLLFCITLFHATKTTILDDMASWAVLTSALMAVGIYLWFVVLSYHTLLVQPHLMSSLEDTRLSRV